MLKELYTAALGMIPQQTRLEITANNIANANSTGFKRVGVFEQSLIEARENQLNVRGDAEQEDPPTQNYTDFSLGSMQKTSNPLDIASENAGFFMVQDADGNEFLTRAGSFTISDDGFIVSADGKKLMGTNGALQITNQTASNSLMNDRTALQVSISRNGEVFADKQLIGQIEMAKVENPQTLLRVSGTMFAAQEDTQYAMMDSNEISVKQGYIEMSNVNIINEMVTMIMLQRSFEMGQKVISTNDGTLDRAIEVGRFA